MFPNFSERGLFRKWTLLPLYIKRSQLTMVSTDWNKVMGQQFRNNTKTNMLHNQLSDQFFPWFYRFGRAIMQYIQSNHQRQAKTLRALSTFLSIHLSLLSPHFILFYLPSVFTFFDVSFCFRVFRSFSLSVLAFWYSRFLRSSLSLRLSHTHLFSCFGMCRAQMFVRA